MNQQPQGATELLGVGDYERAKAFYAALGWSPERETEERAFFQANGVVLVLWERSKLAADMGIEDEAALGRDRPRPQRRFAGGGR